MTEVLLISDCLRGCGFSLLSRWLVDHLLIKDNESTVHETTPNGAVLTKYKDCSASPDAN